MKFFAEEVEAVLDAHPAIARSRVRAERHAQLGELPVAEVVLEEGHAAPKKKDLVVHCRAQLPSYQIPRRFDVLDALPLTPTGKIRRWEPDSAAGPAEPSE
jgi:acyl-CoA synthetase (AMP-forming)/AMP-acid ligase II